MSAFINDVNNTDILHALLIWISLINIGFFIKKKIFKISFSLPYQIIHIFIRYRIIEYKELEALRGHSLRKLPVK